MTKQNFTEAPKLVYKVSMIDTVRGITPGATVTFDCRTACLLTTANSCVTRLNQAAGRKEFEIHSDDNGATYTIKRNL